MDVVSVEGQKPTHANDHQAEEHHCNVKLCSRFLHASKVPGVYTQIWELSTSQEVHKYVQLLYPSQCFRSHSVLVLVLLNRLVWVE